MKSPGAQLGGLWRGAWHYSACLRNWHVHFVLPIAHPSHSPSCTRPEAEVRSYPNAATVPAKEEAGEATGPRERGCIARGEEPGGYSRAVRRVVRSARGMSSSSFVPPGALLTCSVHVMLREKDASCLVAGKLLVCLPCVQEQSEQVACSRAVQAGGMIKSSLSVWHDQEQPKRVGPSRATQACGMIKSSPSTASMHGFNPWPQCRPEHG
eukprot:1153959-Pelagomonas_calceolata.AAC.4